MGMVDPGYDYFRAQCDSYEEAMLLKAQNDVRRHNDG